MVHLYQVIYDLQALATASNSAYTKQQLIKLGLKLVKNMNKLEKARKRWLLLPAASHTSLNFKTCFTTEWNNLCRLQGPTMQDTMFHQQANLL